jgi:hypothetical protein
MMPSNQNRDINAKCCSFRLHKMPRHQAPEEEAAALSDLGQRLLASRGLSNAKEKIRGSHDVNYRINSTPKNMHKLRHGAGFSRVVGKRRRGENYSHLALLGMRK